MSIAASASVHASSFVDPGAQVAEGVTIGPFSVVEAGAVVGQGCQVAARVSIKAGVTLGRDNIVEEGAVLGGGPQHLSRDLSPGQVIIGDGNVIRENVTIHRPMTEGGVTLIGDECLLMVAAHVAHDCVLGDRVVLTNNTMLAGHVHVGERAYLGGGAAVHQHCRIGPVAMVGGMARVTQDVPPYVVIDGGSGSVVGLNRVGLRRAGYDLDAIRAIKAAYRVIYRSGMSLEDRLAELETQFATGPASAYAPFLRDSDRGFTRERRTPPNAPLHVLPRDAEEAPTSAARRAG